MCVCKSDVSADVGVGHGGSFRYNINIEGGGHTPNFGPLSFGDEFFSVEKFLLFMSRRFLKNVGIFPYELPGHEALKIFS